MATGCSLFTSPEQKSPIHFHTPTNCTATTSYFTFHKTPLGRLLLVSISPRHSLSCLCLHAQISSCQCTHSTCAERPSSFLRFLNAGRRCRPIQARPPAPAIPTHFLYGSVKSLTLAGIEVGPSWTGTHTKEGWGYVWPYIIFLLLFYAIGRHYTTTLPTHNALSHQSSAFSMTVKILTN